ncbi:MAG: 50S ribosomal protein L6 [Spirochaetes bacterium]|jgi:large subunit ribosomal protein L6|nr:50S ribosomal protein L6 [Spirochaetota bacterium]
MSRIGKKPINIPEKVSYEISGNKISVKGPLGEDTCEYCDGLIIKEESGSLWITKSENPADEKDLNAKYGLYRSLIANVFEGVSKGFEKKLEINGVGYRAQQQENDVQFNLGYSHPVVFKAPSGIKIEVNDQTHLTITGYNKQQVGQVAANIRELRPPEPYKGKGIKYSTEFIRRKAGKAGK